MWQKFVQSVFLVLLSIILLGMSMAANAEEVVLAREESPYAIYYGSRGKPEEAGMDVVTLLEVHYPLAINVELGIIDLELQKRLEMQYGFNGQEYNLDALPTIDYYTGIVIIRQPQGVVK